MDDNLVNSIVKGIAYTENGGKPNLSSLKSGKTGEMKSIFQFTPDSWKRDAGEVLGNPNIPLNPDTETYVVRQKVKKWIQEGKTAKQIASMWNAGPGEPDAYTGKFSTGKSSTGVNKKYNVPFNVPDYANKVLKYSKQFYQESNPSGQTNQMTTQPKPQGIPPVLNSIVSMMKKATVQPKSQKTQTQPLGLLQQVMKTRGASRVSSKPKTV